jgi:ABC-type nitrate/sulfonate/bicarbonate transport system substrate-binding protein
MSCSKPQKTGPLLDDQGNIFIAEMTKQINKIHEENNKRIELILAKHREEIRTTAEERDAKHRQEIKEILDKHKEEIQKLNAEHDAAFTAAITQLQEQHQIEIRKIQDEYAKLATELRDERARTQQLGTELWVERARTQQQLASMPLNQILLKRFDGSFIF